LTRVSSPGRRLYFSYTDIPRVSNGLGIGIISTSKGSMKDADCRRNKAGGELLCNVCPFYIMSRIGKQPVPIPDKVKVSVNGDTVLVEGPKGKVQKTFAPVVKVTITNKEVTFAPSEDTRFSNAMYGTVRSIVAGMVKGVTEGYSKDLE
ncbi:hypothetical protein OY671_011771, partial [Metschnikowia pulcherrima]